MAKPSRKNIDELRVENAKLRAENQQLRRFGAYSGITKVVGDVCRMGRSVGPWIFGWLAVKSWAGTTTTTLIGANVQANVHVESDSLLEALKTFLTSNLLTTLAVIFALTSIAYGRLQAKLRGDTIEKFHPQLEKAQKEKDPKRSTSRLTQRGETHPKDE